METAKYFFARMKEDHYSFLFMSGSYDEHPIVLGGQVVRIFHCKTFAHCPFTVEPLGPGVAHCCTEDDFVRITDTDHVLLRDLSPKKPMAYCLQPVGWKVRMLRLQRHLLRQAQQQPATSEAAPACEDQHRAFV